MLRQLNSQAATGGGLSDTTFTTHEDPLQRLLINNVFQRWFREIDIINIEFFLRWCHFCCCFVWETREGGGNQKESILTMNDDETGCCLPSA
jgi:hypothetical protein